ncbi:MAG: fumarylacetoacetate hydrolase family protein [Nitrososphaerales archaeon]
MSKLSAIESAGEAGFMRGQIAQFRWKAPLSPIRNILCVGKNYAAHIKERTRIGDSMKPLEATPIFFTKATTSVIGSGESVIAWKSTSQVDYEAELAVVIGPGGRDIPKKEAIDHIMGYTLVNDVTARDLQDAHRQWFRGKSLDTFCPLGPFIVTRDEVECRSISTSP